jgi:hypothetical protein
MFVAIVAAIVAVIVAVIVAAVFAAVAAVMFHGRVGLDSGSGFPDSAIPVFRYGDCVVTG